MSDNKVVALPTENERQNMDNMNLWNKVCETDPVNTKKANVKGNKITCIAPQTQIMQATKMFGPYGSAWGFKSMEFDYSLKDIGLVVFNAVFYYPNQQDNSKTESFPISNSVGLYKDKAKEKIDDDFAKKVETDTLTKALSKIGFNADIFLGKYDDSRYVEDMKQEFEQKRIQGCKEVQEIKKLVRENNVNVIMNNWNTLITEFWNNLDSETINSLMVIEQNYNIEYINQMAHRGNAKEVNDNRDYIKFHWKNLDRATQSKLSEAKRLTHQQ